jgi:hypothetical protein
LHLIPPQRQLAPGATPESADFFWRDHFLVFSNRYSYMQDILVAGKTLVAFEFGK